MEYLPKSTNNTIEILMMLIQTYTKSWIQNFNDIREELNEALSALNVAIEYVGSTAIPKLAAKPIIDIDIVFGQQVAFEDIKRRLEKIGYYHKGNQGIPNREVFKRSKTAAHHGILDAIEHHLYVCPADSEELENHILLRDYLIAHEEARLQYQNLKYALAEEANQDRKKYAQLKEVKASPFILTIIAKAKIPTLSTYARKRT